MKLEARSFDDELRKLVGMFRGTAVEALLAKDHKRMDSLHAASARWARLVHKRIGVILPTLY